ncbi:MAG: hypothetical protein R2909_23495, partial [Gemmatimonadales bacterium]
MSEERYDDSAPALGRLREGPVPPAELEERVVGALARRGVLRAGEGRASRRGWIGGVAAALAAGLGGFALGRGGFLEPSIRSGPRWLLLLFEDEAFEVAPPAEAAAVVAEYAAWADGLRERGLLVDAGRLLEQSALVQSERLVPGSGAERTPIGAAGGYFVVV